MVRMLKDWGLALVVGVAVFFFAELISRRTVDHGPAPAFELADVAGGTLSLAALEGKPVIINFWATWCGPCRQEIPEFAAWHAANPDVAMLGLAVRSGDPAKVKADAARLGITWPVAIADDAVLDAYAVDVYPTTVFVRADGQIATSVQGAIDEKELDRLVKSALR